MKKHTQLLQTFTPCHTSVSADLVFKKSISKVSIKKRISKLNISADENPSQIKKRKEKYNATPQHKINALKYLWLLKKKTLNQKFKLLQRKINVNQGFLVTKRANKLPKLEKKKNPI